MKDTEGRDYNARWTCKTCFVSPCHLLCPLYEDSRPHCCPDSGNDVKWLEGTQEPMSGTSRMWYCHRCSTQTPCEILMPKTRDPARCVGDRRKRVNWTVMREDGSVQHTLEVEVG